MRNGANYAHAMFDWAFPWISSDAAQLGTSGALAALVAALAVWAERRRLRRRMIDAVGCMPWTAIFLLAFLAACVLLGLAARAWFLTP